MLFSINKKTCKAISQTNGFILLTREKKTNIYKIKHFDLEKQEVKGLMPMNEEQ